MDMNITVSERTKEVMELMGLDGTERTRIEGIYHTQVNLGVYEDFLPHLKGMRGRRQLYESIEDDICQHIWHKDLGKTEPMPKGWRV